MPQVNTKLSLKRINRTRASLISAATLSVALATVPFWGPSINDWVHGPSFNAYFDNQNTTISDFEVSTGQQTLIAPQTETAIRNTIDVVFKANENSFLDQPIETLSIPVLADTELPIVQTDSTPLITAEQLTAQGIEDLRLTDEGIYYRDWDITNSGYLEIERTAEASGIPLHFLLAVFAKESSLEEGAINSSRASGYGQLMPVTMAELAYQFAETVGFTGVENFVERVNVAEENANPIYRYPYQDTTSQHTMINASFVPAFNTRISGVNMIRDIGSMQRSLSEFTPNGMDYYPVQAVHAYAAVFAGGGGGRDLLRDMIKNDGNSQARDFFDLGALKSKINQRLVYFTKIEQETNTETGEVTDKIVTDFDRPKTVAQFYEYISSHLGDVSTLTLPDFRNSREAINVFGENLKLAGVEPIEIKPLFAPMFPDARPVSRVQGTAAAALARANEVEATSAPTTSLRPAARPTSPTPNRS